ncbi:MAG: 6-pyruvoyl-tetrahydropterin synthase-related protein [Pseudomonadota bacterium]
MLLRSVLSVVLISLALTLFIAAGYSNGHSSSHNFSWATEYIEVFSWNTLLPRHLPGLWSQLGGYDFFFYGPAPFFVLGTIVEPLCRDCSVETLVVCSAALFWFGSACAFYLFIRRHLDKTASLFGALVYAILPYHLLIDWFFRQALGEFAAYAFLPLIAYGFETLRKERNRGWVLALGVAGTTLCHLPTALLVAHVFTLITLLISWQQYHEGRNPIHFFGSVFVWTALGGLLSSFYWLPALALMGTVSPDLLYTEHFVAGSWLYGLSFDQPDFESSLYILLSFAVAVPFLISGAFAADKIGRIWILTLPTVTLLLNVDPAAFIWENWIISKVQFPWRMMVFVDFATAMAIAFTVEHLPSKRWSAVLCLCAAVAFLPSSLIATQSSHWIETKYDGHMAKIGAAEYLSKETVSAIRQNLDVDETHIINRNNAAPVLKEAASQAEATAAKLINFEVLSRRTHVVVLTDAPLLIVPIQFWQLWEAETEDGVKLALSPHPTWGTLNIELPAGNFKGKQVTLTLPFHWSEKVGFLTSGLSLALLLAHTWTNHRRRAVQLK